MSIPPPIIGLQGGDRTQHFTGLKPVASADWATWSFGGQGGGRTHGVSSYQILSLARLSNCGTCPYGAPSGDRTRVTAVKERCLNHLTTGAFLPGPDSNQAVLLACSQRVFIEAGTSLYAPSSTIHQLTSADAFSGGRATLNLLLQ